MKKLGKKRELEKMTVNAYCASMCACSCDCGMACYSSCGNCTEQITFASVHAASNYQAYGSIANTSGSGMAAALNQAVSKQPY